MSQLVHFAHGSGVDVAPMTCPCQVPPQVTIEVEADPIETRELFARMVNLERVKRCQSDRDKRQ